MVYPDLIDFRDSIDDLRRAFHLSISLFHMGDWVYWNNEPYIKSNFTFQDKNGASQNVNDEKTFANALRDINPNFELIRGIANSAKHLQIKNPTKVHHTHAPSHAANTVVQSTGYGQGDYGQGPYGGTPRVMLEGPSGSDMEFLCLAETVYQMWIDLAQEHCWELVDPNLS